MDSAQIKILDQHGHPIRASDTAHFAASRTARELAGWTPTLTSADQDLLGEGETIAARAHDLARNHGIASGAIRTATDNIVGTGLRLAAKPDYLLLGRDKEWADAFAREIEAKWRSFADSPDFDAARDLTFGGMTVMQLRTAFLDGDAVALPMWMPGRPGAKWATCLQAIDPARLMTPDNRQADTRIRRGVEVNEYGEKVAYWFKKTHPGESFIAGQDSSFERVEARTRWGRRKVIHLYEKLRPGQSRGKSLLTAVMAGFRMLDHYQRMELQTAVVNSMIAAFIETPLRGEDIAELFGSGQKFIDSRGGWDVKLQGASIIPLHPGDKLNAFTPTRPSSAYASFVENVLRAIAAGINMPYELLLKDFSKTNYSSARAALLEAWRYFMGMREWLSTGWCDPVYELWFEEAVNAGEIDAPDFYENKAAYLRCKWVGPGRGWIDPLKEAQAATERMKSGISTLEDETAEQGGDWQERLEQRARERQYALSLGLTDIHAPPAQGGAPGQAGAPTQDPEDPPDGQDPEDPLEDDQETPT